MFVWFAAYAAIVTVSLLMLARSAEPAAIPDSDSAIDGAIAVSRTRLARGEITAEEFERIAHTLRA